MGCVAFTLWAGNRPPPPPHPSRPRSVGKCCRGKRGSRDDRPLAAGEQWWSLLSCHTCDGGRQVTAFPAASGFETGRGLPRNKEGMIKNWFSLGAGGGDIHF